MVADETLLTADEVNQRLPLVRSIVGDIVSLHADISFRRQRLLSLRERHPAPKSNDSVYEQEVLQMESELADDEVRLGSYAQELLDIGGFLTDPAEGRVDFLGDLGGERVFFCWQSAEPEVLGWHSGACGESERILLDHELGSMTISEGK
jgi:hypothetical protein